MRETDSQERMQRARYIIAQRLSSTYKAWSVEGNFVKGPGTLAVRVEDQHCMGPNHFDIVVLNNERADVPVLWDCVAGMGATSNEVIDRAVETWVVSTLPVFLELVNRDGSFADRFDGGDPGGCPGWHVIHGPVLAFGIGAAPDVLQDWTLTNPLLPTIGPLAVKMFNRRTLNCVKVLFGSSDGEIVEVSVNGMCDHNASERLESLAWPRSTEAAFARCFFLFVHSDDEMFVPLMR
jgi:Family of unknown function (DUF6348)